MALDYSSQNAYVQTINDMGDVRLGCQFVKQLASELNFSAVQREHIHIATKEISSNLLVHHTIDPCLAIYKVQQANKNGITVVATDHGPGITSISHAMADHHSTAGSMGCGLGAVQRLMDEFHIHSSLPEKPRSRCQSYAAGGTTLIATKWNAQQAERSSAFQWGGISRPKPGFKANGDAYYLQETDTEIHILLVDGLGHGEEAEIASQAAIAIYRENLHMPLDALIPLLHSRLRTTRGAAIMLMRLNKSRRDIQHVGIGNIEAVILPKQTSTPLSRAGVLGSGLLVNAEVKTLPWPDNGMLILHSDGLSRRWGDDLNLQTHRQQPLLLSHILLRDYGRFTDDAAILILCENK